jgi:hypothetical protein
MTTLTARPAAAPPLRALLVLTAAVLLVHAWLLQAAPAHWGATAESPRPLRPLVTRNIEIRPPSAATVAAPPPPVRRTPRPSPVQRPNPAPALDTPAPPAIEFIAPLPAETPAPPAPPPVEPGPPAGPEASPAAAEPAAPAPTATAGALSIPGSMRMNYAMTGRSKNMDYQAQAQLDWLQDGESYRAHMRVSAFLLGERSMSSNGRITGDGLAPLRFLDKSRSERAAHFQTDKGKITFSANTPEAPWQAGAQDRLSVFLQLASLLAGDPASYPAGSSVSIYTAGPTAADTWTFNIEGEETLHLPLGDTRARKLSRKPQRDYDQTVEVWLAPALDWLPARIRITQQNGDFVDQQLRSAEKPP